MNLAQNPEILKYQADMLQILKPPNNDNLLHQVTRILRKPYENRNINEQATLMNFINEYNFLRQMGQQLSFQTVKGIMRHAIIVNVKQRKLICTPNQPIQEVLIVLSGKIGVCQSKQEMSENLQTSAYNLFELLTEIAQKQAMQGRDKILRRKSSFCTNGIDFQPPTLTEKSFNKLKYKNILGKDDEYGMKLRCHKKVHSSQAVILENSTLLIFQTKSLFYWLNTAFKNRLGQKIVIMKSLSIFQQIEEKKLIDLILSMQKKSKKRNQVIYEQGHISDKIYILLEGDVSISKDADLFVQNPNNLYAQRSKLYRNNNIKQEQETQLPYANLTTLYNYRPRKKNIKIGIMSPICLFGDEQLIDKRQRQAIAVVHSLQATYYEIECEKLQEILGVKSMQVFQKRLQKSMIRKVLYRQMQFASNVNLQNKNNLDYFYYDGDKAKESSRKYKLDKINHKIKPIKILTTKDKNTPFFTTFNFNKLLNKSSISDNNSSQLFSPSEQQIMLNSHSWKPVQSKVIQELKLSLKISPHKHQININEPLIEQNYFKSIAKQKKRIDHEQRMLKLSLGKIKR